MQRGFLIATTVVFGCAADQPGATTVPPWTSGRDVRAQVYVADGFRGLAGRKNTAIDFSCRVDPTALPSFKDCPTGTWKLYRSTDCTGYDLALGVDQPVTNYAVGSAGDFYQKVGDYDGFAVSKAPDDTCTIPNGARIWPVLAPFDPAPLRLGVATHHMVHNIGYTSLDVDDGFSVVTSIDGGALEIVDNTSARLRARYADVIDRVRKYIGVFDSKLGTNCDIAEDPSGQLRCVSGGTQAFVTTDPGCRAVSAPLFSTSPTLLTYRQDQSVPFYPRSRPDKLFRCVPTTRTLYTGSHGSLCKMVTDTSPYLECTEELSFDMFEPVSLTVE